jgi:hypothetical protein
MRLDEQVVWEKISTQRESVLPAGDYLCVIKSVEDDTTETSQLPRTTVKAEVVEGDHAGREIWDGIVMKTKKGEVNKRAMGAIKEWALATVGAERLAAPDFDTKEFEGHTVRIVTKIGSYDEDDPTPGAAPGAKRSKPKTEIVKILRA